MCKLKHNQFLSLLVFFVVLFSPFTSAEKYFTSSWEYSPTPQVYTDNDGSFTLAWLRYSDDFEYTLAIGTPAGNWQYLTLPGGNRSGEIIREFDGLVNGTYQFFVTACYYYYDHSDDDEYELCDMKARADVTVSVSEPVHTSGTLDIVTYRYDALGRLRQVDKNGSVQEGYQYDKAGNRCEISVEAVAEGYCQ